MHKILIVEDDHSIGLMIKDILEFKGYEVILSKKPEQTVDIITNDGFDLLIIDKLMSGIDGTDVCAKIRNSDGFSNIPILMMSALSDVKEICLAAGATDFIYKPFGMQHLHEKVKIILGKRSV